jgi:preprotein translocase subunit YajC
MLGKVNAVVAAILLSSGAYALAQAPGVQPGMQVVDTAGNPVGVITSMKNGNVVLKTDKHEVQLPASSFTPSNGKLLFGMTQAQVDAAAEQAVAEGQAAIKPGAEIYGMGGTLAGTIDSMDDQYVTIKLTSGELVRVPKSGVAAGNGKVVVGATVEQLKAGAAQASATPAAPATDSGS